MKRTTRRRHAIGMMLAKRVTSRFPGFPAGGDSGTVLGADRLRRRRFAARAAPRASGRQRQAKADTQETWIARERQAHAAAGQRVPGVREHGHEAQEVVSDDVGHAAAGDGARRPARQGRAAQAKESEVNAAAYASGATLTTSSAVVRPAATFIAPDTR